MQTCLIQNGSGKSTEEEPDTGTESAGAESVLRMVGRAEEAKCGDGLPGGQGKAGAAGGDEKLLTCLRRDFFLICGYDAGSPEYVQAEGSALGVEPDSVPNIITLQRETCRGLGTDQQGVGMGSGIVQDVGGNTPLCSGLPEGTALTVYNDGTIKSNRNQNICLAFTVADVEAEYQKLLAMGAEIIEKPTKRPWGATNMSFYDPDRNVVYFRSFAE